VEVEISQAIFLLKIAGVAQAGFAEVDCGHARVRLAQRMNGSLRRSTAGDQDLSICPLLFGGPQQKRHRPASIRVAIEFAVPIEITDRRRIWVTIVESAHSVGWIRGRRCPRVFLDHMGRFVLLSVGQRYYTKSKKFTSLQSQALMPDFAPLGHGTSANFATKPEELPWEAQCAKHL